MSPPQPGDEESAASQTTTTRRGFDWEDNKSLRWSKSRVSGALMFVHQPRAARRRGRSSTSARFVSSRRQGSRESLISHVRCTNRSKSSRRSRSSVGQRDENAMMLPLPSMAGNRLGSIQPDSGSLLSRVMTPLSRSNTNTSDRRDDDGLQEPEPSRHRRGGGQQVSVQLTLELGAVTEDITVTAAARHIRDRGNAECLAASRPAARRETLVSRLYNSAPKPQTRER